jgi:hypothetical protein
VGARALAGRAPVEANPTKEEAMRRSVSAFGALATAALLLAPAVALAGEKLQGNMASPSPAGYFRDFCNAGHIPVPPAPGFMPGVSQAKFQFKDNCSGKIRLKLMAGLPPSDGVPGTGDEIYCLVNFYQAQTPACGSFILRSEVLTSATGVQSAKALLNGPAELPGVCPPGPGTTAHVTSVECYAPDLAYGPRPPAAPRVGSTPRS